MAPNVPAVFNLRLQLPAALLVSAYHWNTAYHGSCASLEFKASLEKSV